MLRIVLPVNGMALLAILAQAESWQDIAQRMIEISAHLQPVLLSGMLLLFALNPLLERMAYRQGAAAVLLLVVAVTLAISLLGGRLYNPPGEYGHFHLLRCALLGAAAAVLLLAYFRSRAHALSPASHEARLLALQARIRPHFLFNSINAVLGIVRNDPRRAETALEDMSDLFRAAMAHSGDLVPVRHEVALARQYLALEQLRLGERLKVEWRTEDMPDDALVPPLVLQPLLENAVYHGIEPLAGGGAVYVRLYRSGDEMHIEVHNPQQEQPDRHEGNKMALSNIRERLALQFDVEARYEVETGNNFYRVHIMLPYVKENTDEHR
ncbi:MAG: histidine kinase [Nitrosomonadales bacterium]|nr:histidine kinase [Nitrosomonadales bacterium]